MILEANDLDKKAPEGTERQSRIELLCNRQKLKESMKRSRGELFPFQLGPSVLSEPLRYTFALCSFKIMESSPDITLLRKLAFLLQRDTL